jgi:hypothetical protein
MSLSSVSPGDLAKCNLGRVGLVQAVRLDGQAIGVTLFPLEFLGKPWESRDPRWVGSVVRATAVEMIEEMKERWDSQQKA